MSRASEALANQRSGRPVLHKQRRGLATSLSSSRPGAVRPFLICSVPLRKPSLHCCEEGSQSNELKIASLSPMPAVRPRELGQERINQNDVMPPSQGHAL